MTSRIRTDRLALRPLCAADVPAITRTAGRMEVARWLTRVPHPYTVMDACWFVGQAAPWRFAITLRGGDDTLIGVIAIEAELGYWLAPAHWGRGLMREAAGAVTDAWFSGDGMSLASGHFADNGASRAILRGLGFEETGRGTRHCAALGARRDFRHLALTRARWQGQKAH